VRKFTRIKTGDRGIVVWLPLEAIEYISIESAEEVVDEHTGVATADESGDGAHCLLCWTAQRGYLLAQSDSIDLLEQVATDFIARLEAETR